MVVYEDMFGEEVIPVGEDLPEMENTIWDRYREFLEKVSFMASQRLERLAEIENIQKSGIPVAAMSEEKNAIELTEEERKELEERAKQRKTETLLAEYKKLFDESENKDNAFLMALYYLIIASQEQGEPKLHFDKTQEKSP